MVFAYNAEEHAKLQKQLDESKANCDQAILDMQQVFDRFEVDDVAINTTPFGNYITIDINPDEAQEFASRVLAELD